MGADASSCARQTEAGTSSSRQSSEGRFRKQQLQTTDGLDGRLNLGAMAAQQLGHFAQNAEHLALLFLTQPHELVVQVDGLEGLDE